MKPWIEFLSQNKGKYEIIKRDTWVMFLHLIQQTGNDFNKFHEVDDGSWPTIFDDFSEFITQMK